LPASARSSEGRHDQLDLPCTGGKSHPMAAPLHRADKSAR
jgi:hypothetical protein